MKCKILIDFKSGEKYKYIIGVADTVVIDGAYIKIFEQRNDDCIFTKFAWDDIKTIKIEEVKDI